MKLMKDRKAFTIVEMVIVIAVIAILATVLVPTISGVIDKANHSADQQFVASLNIQLALWQVDNGQIENESDLRAAINSYYGEEGEDFYSSLAPKSANRGYHFWYSVADQQVVLAKYEELSGSVAPTAAVEPTFSPASPRSLIINDKNYFLMDQAGSVIVDNLRAIESVDGNGAYGLAVAQLLATEAETDLAAQIASRLQNIAIANVHGVFFVEDWAGPVRHVYVPYGTETLGASKISAGKTIEVSEIILPDTLTQIGTGSLLGYTIVPDGNLYVGSTTIFAEVEENQLSTFVATDSFDCVLEIPTGERFAFVGGQLKKLGTDVIINTQYSVELQSFVVSAPADENKQYDLHAWVDGSNPVVHYTSDFAGSVTLTASNFVDVNGDSASRTASWVVGTETIKGNTVTLTKDDLDANLQITVTTQNLTYTIDIIKVAVDSFTASIGGVNGEPHEGADGYAYYTATLEYKKGSTWAVNAQVGLAPVVSCVTVSDETTIDVSGTGASNLIVDGTSLKVKDDVNGTFEATVTITTVGADATGKKNSIKYVLTFNKASATFDIADNADTQDTYGLKFTVGTVQPIKLGTLFKLISGEPSDIVVTWSNNGSNPTPFAFTSQSGDWTNWEITPSTAGDNFIISISDGGDSCSLNVKVVNGAYNVASAEQWLSVPNQTSIAVLKPFTMVDTETKLSTAMNGGNSLDETGAGKVSKYMYSAKMYGNYNKITFGKFLIKSPNKSTGSNNYFIYSNGGLFEYVVIDGPEYGTVAKSWKSTEAVNGYYVAGLEVAGSTKINNCYISGFRSPVRVDGGNVVISNTTLQGGAYACIYVRGANSLTLNDTIVIQKKNEYGKIGAGVYFDCLNKNGGENTVSFVLNGDTHLYNWLSDSETYSDTSIKAIKNALFDGGCDDAAVDFVHNFADSNGDTDNRANACVAAEKDGNEYDAFKQLTIQDNSNGMKLCTKDDAVTNGDYSVYSYKKCSGTCAHEMFPDNNPNYDVDDFIKAQKSKIVN